MVGVESYRDEARGRFVCVWGGGLNVSVCVRRDQKRLTKNRSCRNRLPIEPERDLRENDGHNAWEVCLDHKITDFSFQVEMGCHDNILSWKRTGGGRGRGASWKH